MNSPPAQTSVSLLASATIAPRSAAASVGRSPAAPVIAPITHCAGRCAASTTALSPAAGLDAGAGQRALEFAIGGLVADRREARADLARQRGQRRGIGVRTDGLDPIAPALALDQIDGARTDRSGRAQQRHAALAARGLRIRGFTAVFAVIRSPYQQAARRCIHTAMREADQAGKHGRRHKAIQPVHQPAMAGDQ